MVDGRTLEHQMAKGGYKLYTPCKGNGTISHALAFNVAWVAHNLMGQDHAALRSTFTAVHRTRVNMGSLRLSAAYIAFLSVGLLTSCSYRLVRLEYVDGRKAWGRFYKDEGKRQDHQVRSIFKHEYKAKISPRYLDAITTDTVAGIRWFQYDTVRLFILENAAKHEALFRTGILSPRTFWCARGDTCMIPDKTCGWTYENGEPVIRDTHGWSGHTLLIEEIRDMDQPKGGPTSRRFLLYSRLPCAYGGRTVHLIEVTNPNAHRSTSLEDFIEGAALSFFAYAWSEV